MGRREDSGWSDWLLTAVIALVVAFALIIAVKGGIQVTYSALGEQEPKWLSAFDAGPVAKTFNLLVVTTVIVAGAYVGYRKFFLFRENKAQLTVSLTVSSRYINDDNAHIGAIAKAENTGKVNVDVDKIDWELAVISPYDNTTLREMQDEYNKFIKEEQERNDENVLVEDVEFPWHIIQSYSIERWGMNVEPGETEELTFDFIVPVEIRSVVVSLFIENQETEQDEESTGWHRRKFHDIIESASQT